VVAVGSNGVPGVVHAKLAAAGVVGDVPFLPGEVRGLGVAHSAHVSPGGYVPTTAYAEPGAVLTLVVSWFTTEQLAALDATEPNYTRLPLPGAPGDLADAYVYVSRWGVLAPGGEPLAPTTQAEVHRVLGADAGLRALLPLADPEATVAALRDRAVAERVRSRFAALSWVARTGLA
jgi:hypothetical protein